MKICKDCIFCKPWLGYLNYRDKQCFAPQLETEEVNPVDGARFRKKEMCIEVRRDENLCGWEGTWWKSKFVSSESKPKVAARTKQSTPTLEDLI